jgi:hypothetical protein
MVDVRIRGGCWSEDGVGDEMDIWARDDVGPLYGPVVE